MTYIVYIVWYDILVVSDHFFIRQCIVLTWCSLRFWTFKFSKMWLVCRGDIPPPHMKPGPRLKGLGGNATSQGRKLFHDSWYVFLSFCTFLFPDFKYFSWVKSRCAWLVVISDTQASYFRKHFGFFYRELGHLTDETPYFSLWGI